MGVDLHLHTLHSDGLFTPGELVDRCAELGVATLAITDHDEVRGAIEARGAAAAAGVALIDGAEVSTQVKGFGVHILAYGVRVEDGRLLELLARNRAAKRVQIDEMARRLTAMGMAIDTDALVAGRAADAYVGRAHLARALLGRHLRHRSTIYKRYIGFGCPAYVPARLAAIEDVLEAIHGAGGLAVLAHPSLDDLSLVLPELIRLGIDGVEAYRPRRTHRHRHLAASLADRAGLCVTGGSDWHGEDRDAAPGQPLWPRQLFAEFFERLEREGGERDGG